MQACSAEIRIVEVNRRTLDLFGAADRDDRVRNLPVVFRDEMLSTHIDELVQLWSGATRCRGRPQCPHTAYGWIRQPAR